MIRFELNGAVVETNRHPMDRLLEVLREEFALTAVKEGCGEGECGACAVIVNGNLVNSCITPIGNVRGATIVTLEGYRNTERYRFLERMYAKAGAVQCGYCIPGMIMATEVLLAQNPHPSDGEIREGISGNLCRCTGYNMIVEAIMMAVEQGAELWE